MKHNYISIKEALTLLAQTIRQPGWDLEAIETRLDILMKELGEFEKELQEAQTDPFSLTGNPLVISVKKASKEDLQYREGWRQATFRILRLMLGEGDS